MKKYKVNYIQLILILFLFQMQVFISCQGDESESTKVDYYGLEIPKDKPEIFAPAIISLKDRWEGNVNFSQDGKELYFDVFIDSMRNRKIYYSKNIKGEWSTPKPFSVLGDYDNQEAFINYTNDVLYYTSTRPPGEEEWNTRTWKIEKGKNNKWGEPQLIDYGVNPKNGFWYPNHSRLNSSILYFGGKIEEIDSTKNGELYYYDVKHDTVVNIIELSSSGDDFDPYIAPDESYILFASNREGGYGRSDLYVSFKKGDSWGNPINLGEKINTPKHELAPRISSDGKVLFYDCPWNWKQDIYWVSSTIIEDLRNKK